MAGVRTSQELAQPHLWKRRARPMSDGWREGCRRSLSGDGEFTPIEMQQPVRAVSALHFADGEPFAHEERLIFLGPVPEAREASFAEEPPGTWLLHHVPWQEAEHVISADSATAGIAGRLGIEIGAACLVVARRTWRNGALITAVRLVYPGQRQRLVARFTPAGPAAR